MAALIPATGHVATPEATALILGAGPAGLTAAYELARRGVRSVVLEKDSCVGGLSRTVEYRGYRFDIGGHRFYTKVALIRRIWKEVLGDDLLTCRRLSRICYRSRLFHYPLEALDVAGGLGLVEIARCGLSYLRSRIRLRRPELDFETWVSNRFGKRLFEIFFRAYTEKVWGMPCRQIHSDWAAQRIRGLSFTSAVGSSLPFLPLHNGSGGLRTLTREFLYPRLGPGMMWSRVRQIVEAAGSPVLLESPVERILWKPGGVIGVVAGGRTFHNDHYISSLPIAELIALLDPAPPDWVKAAASCFRYRDFITVALILDRSDLFPDHWIYIHEPEVRVGRIQNYRNWSPEMCPDSSTTCLGLEYFCSEGDSLWLSSDDELLALARRELSTLGLDRGARCLDGKVVRVRKAYPVYDEHYKGALERVREFLESVPNLQFVGRNGMHRYNNQDHAMLTGILAARNILGARFDLWNLRLDEGFGEVGDDIKEEEIAALESSQPMVPTRL
jgi:protoporphyrinogen oxidase